MKIKCARIIQLIALQLITVNAFCQKVINGGFELNDLECSYNLANSSFNSHVQFITAVGSKSEIDVITDTCGYGPAFEGKDFVALYGGVVADAIILELNEPLKGGREYTLYYACKEGTNQHSARLKIGFSEGQGLGNLKYKSDPFGNDWIEQKLVFVADAPYRFIGVAPDSEGWIFVDGFYFGCPEIDLGNDTAFCVVEGTVLNVEQAFDSIKWNTGETEPIIIVDEAGEYVVEAHYNECIKRDTIVLTEIEYNCNCQVYFPNAFSPNGDGFNDYFEPYSPCLLSDYELKIFNRWGEIVFNSNNNEFRWNGEINHKNLPSGIYAYLAKFRFPYSQSFEIVKGDILLVK